MNNEKRKRLKNACAYLDRFIDEVSDVLDDERDCLDNMPENLQSSEKCEKMEEIIVSLTDVVDTAEELRDSVSDVCEV